MILEKLLAELGKDKPDISYMRGMLETMIALDSRARPALLPLNTVIPSFRDPIHTLVASGPFPPETAKSDEGAVLDGIAKARLSSVKDFADKSTQR